MYNYPHREKKDEILVWVEGICRCWSWKSEVYMSSLKKSLKNCQAGSLTTCGNELNLTKFSLILLK